ncbi:MAG: histidine kinase [Pyrinomonadaceae bacterium]|nr:histidine kinase [Pyrinomonadaceae bacterium]
MNTLDAASLVNWLGFSVGVALFALLGSMVVRHRGSRYSGSARLLLLATSALGLIWNLGELLVFIFRDFALANDLPFVSAAAYSALGFLPSVVVHSAQNEEGGRSYITYSAYILSTTAGALHFYSAFTGSSVPSDTAQTILTVGAVLLAAALFVRYFGETLQKKVVWATALLVFALSSLHFVGYREGSSPAIELVAHQSSLPIALVILYQNYRFAFADLFLKRAISMILLAAVAFGLYVGVAAPLLRYHESHDRNDVQAISLILLLWIATALVYPKLHQLAVWLVDKVILKRTDYDQLQEEMTRSIQRADSIAEVLDTICSRLAGALTAGTSKWTESDSELSTSGIPSIDFTAERAEFLVPTAERPQYKISIGDFQGGRRLLSDETAMLAAVSLFTARRIDALRVDHERCEQEFRQQEFSKLAAEAELTALRAQINPHFLFNALTTIGYLIQTSPDKAFQTLVQLTKLLRGVLAKASEFCSLNDEIRLVESYLEIEKARFEERLEVQIDVPEELHNLLVPSLILQPLVENAIKHGISENRNGGTLVIKARKDAGKLTLSVMDTGSGKGAVEPGSERGIGLSNITGRLHAHYGLEGDLTLKHFPNGQTIATVSFPVEVAKTIESRQSETVEL